MNNKLFQACFALLALTMSVSCDNHLSNGTYHLVSDGKIDGHEYVDLGLPSGTLWATCNVGAVTPEYYGDYFAWGEFIGNEEGKQNFSYREYDLSVWNNYIEKFEEELDSTHDVARYKWGKNWCMPKYDDWVELKKSCDWVWISFNGVKCYCVSKNKKSIILPASGIYNDSVKEKVDTFGYYWSSSIDRLEIVSICKFDSYYQYDTSNFCYSGLSVRPVSHPAKNVQ